MSSETVSFQNGAETFRIQFDIVPPPPVPARPVGAPRSFAPGPKFQVATIRVTDVTEGVGDDGRKKSINFSRSFDTLAQARTGATEYAKRIIREQMRPKTDPVA